MNIRDLRDGMRRVWVEGEVTNIGKARNANLRNGGSAQVADCILRDTTGEIKLSLWDDQIEQVIEGSRIRVEDGYTNSYRGQIQLNIGKYGNLVVLE